VSEVLARQSSAYSPEETVELLTELLGEGAILGMRTEYQTFTVEVAPESWLDTALTLRDERVLAYDYFDCLFGVDARHEGFDVVAVLYSTSTGNRICLRMRCPGGREAPTCPSIVEAYRGADWHEREAWDMFGIEFEGHPGLEPRILTVENFEGWPLRKDFHLATRVAKPWPGVKEPAETDEDGNVIERVPRIGDAPGPYELDKAMAEQAKLANPAPDTPAEAEEITEQKPGVAEDTSQAEKSPETELDQATYDALIAEGKSERIARSKAKAAFVKKQRQQAADDASDQVAETESGKAVAEDAAKTEVAPDSGQVLSGDVEQDAEEVEAQATEAQKQAAEQATYEEAEAARERVEADIDAPEAESAQQKAEQKRKAAAEARARKAAERAEEAEQAPADQAPDGQAPDAEVEDGEEDA
jgi:NADH:ubiquinone oxidoreductase subunit C